MRILLEFRNHCLRTMWQGQALLSNYVREQLFSLPERLHICTSGFLRVNGRWVFAHDGANIPGSNVVFETGRTIVRDDRISPQAAFRNAAEFLGGSQSSQLRMLILPIMKGDIKGPVLKRFQDNPLLLSSHMYNYLCWAGERGDEIIRFIKDSFQLKRDSLLGVLTEARLVDTAAILMITAGIILQYGKEIHAFAPGTDANILYQWEQAILQAAIESERISRVQNPVAMYLKALFDMMAQKELFIAEDIGTYQAGVHSGYRKDDELWLWTSVIYSRVTKYWVKLGVTFPLSCEKTNEHLFSAGLIKGSREKRSDGREKLLYGCKSAISGRPRLLVLREDLARSYLENEAIQ